MLLSHSGGPVAGLPSLLTGAGLAPANVGRCRGFRHASWNGRHLSRIAPTREISTARLDIERPFVGNSTVYSGAYVSYSKWTENILGTNEPLPQASSSATGRRVWTGRTRLSPEPQTRAGQEAASAFERLALQRIGWSEIHSASSDVFCAHVPFGKLREGDSSGTNPRSVPLVCKTASPLEGRNEPRFRCRRQVPMRHSFCIWIPVLHSENG